MGKFALKEIPILHARIKFHKLIVDGTCEFDTFWEETLKNGNHSKELNTIQSIMERVAGLQLLPQNKFKEISKKNELVKEYEIKSPNLRVYLFKASEGNVVVFGAIKSPKGQNQDISRMRGIKQAYFESLKSPKKEEKAKKQSKTKSKRKANIKKR